MKRTLVTLGVLLIALALAPMVRAVPRTPIAVEEPASAGTQGSCTPSFNASVRFWENAPSDHSDGDDSLWFICNGGANAQNGDLRNIEHTLPGNCNASLGGANWWNNCVTRVQVWLPTQFWRFCAYDGINFNGTVYVNMTGPYWSGDVTLGGAANDDISSARIRYAEGC